MDEAAVADAIVRRFPAARRIVEVGIGRNPGVARRLATRLPGVELVVTDTDGGCLAEHAQLPARAVRDDVAAPDVALYRGADLVYAVRMPPELVGALARLAGLARVPVLLAPLSGDEPAGAGWHPVASGGRVVAWLLEPA
jgi:hypothetical protein